MWKIVFMKELIVEFTCTDIDMHFDLSNDK